MARLAADEMRDIVRDMLGGETTETLSDTRIMRFINMGYLKTVVKFTPDQLRAATPTTITTADGTGSYELSVDTVLKIDDMINTTSNYKLYSFSDTQHHTYNQGADTTGSPIYYRIDGVGSNNRFNISFFPIPDAVYTINVEYFKKPTELVLSPTATSTILPEQLDESIMYRAAYHGWMQLGDPKRAQDYLQGARMNDSDVLDTIHLGSETPMYLGSRVASELV
jgi:hypothetical protein